jgi:hypothetical protein
MLCSADRRVRLVLELLVLCRPREGVQHFVALTGVATEPSSRPKFADFCVYL